MSQPLALKLEDRVIPLDEPCDICKAQPRADCPRCGGFGSVPTPNGLAVLRMVGRYRPGQVLS